MEFHVSREARDRYEFGQMLFSFSGNIVFANLGASREFAFRMNERRGADKDPKQTIKPGALYAMGLIDEMSHALVEYYRKRLDPKVMAGALEWFDNRLGKDDLDKTILGFVEQFPTTDVYRKEKTSVEWLAGSTDGVAHRAVAFEEMMLLWLANANPAFKPFSELFTDQSLAAVTRYQQLTAGLREFFATRPPLGAKKLNLIDMLRAPALASPDSLSGQIAFIVEHWADLIGDSLSRLLLAIDVLKEEDIAIWMRFNPSDANAGRRRNLPWNSEDKRGEVPSFSESAQETERFSPDQEWMPTTVLIAKSTYVWLEQLSRHYGRHIYRLDQIPDEELRRLAGHGINALWLIGVWERSSASQTIKQLCGNQEAVASAYSLYGYNIAHDLGGEPAYGNLRDRAFAHGVRLASDMVPNHMGIDSSWVVEHPEWFMSRTDSPYPSYRFEGPDLSRDGRVEIKIEDHYYEQTDAAVVFRRRDKWTGDIQYVYHGNDGTSFPVERHSAAQLSERCGAGAGHPDHSACRSSVSHHPFRRRDDPGQAPFPTLVVSHSRHRRRDSVARRVQHEQGGLRCRHARGVLARSGGPRGARGARNPAAGRSLLADGRLLRPHPGHASRVQQRVHEHDARRGECQVPHGHQSTIEFDPDILKRYVNFMSNPDERTAIDQFGNGDKCFGVATLMATLPGLPMFGHGQIEGFTEKYGMEFRKARYQEDPDRGLVARHDREIAPLLHQRWLFAESANFLLYDFYRPDGSVDENVFAYSNRRGDHRALVIYHNRYATTYGTIHNSASYADKGAGQLRQQTLGGAFGLPNDGNLFLAFRDVTTGLEHLERAAKIVNQGFSLELQAYHCHVYLHWRHLRPDEHHRWDLLCDFLNGRGVAGVDEALLALEVAPLHDTLAALLRTDLLEGFAHFAGLSAPLPACGHEGESSTPSAQLMREIETLSTRVAGEGLGIYARKTGAVIDWKELWLPICTRLHAAAGLVAIAASEAQMVLPGAHPTIHTSELWGPVVAYCLLEVMAKAVKGEDTALTALALFDRLRLREPLAKAFSAGGEIKQDGWRAAARVRQLFLYQSLTTAKPKTAKATPGDSFAGLPQGIWDDSDARWLLKVHESAGEWYFNKELHQQMLWWTQLPDLLTTPPPIKASEKRVQLGSKQAEEAGYVLGAKKPESAKPVKRAKKVLAKK